MLCVLRVGCALRRAPSRFAGSWVPPLANGLMWSMCRLCFAVQRCPSSPTKVHCWSSRSMTSFRVAFGMWRVRVSGLRAFFSLVLCRGAFGFQVMVDQLVEHVFDACSRHFAGNDGPGLFELLVAIFREGGPDGHPRLRRLRTGAEQRILMLHRDTRDLLARLLRARPCQRHDLLDFRRGLATDAVEQVRSGPRVTEQRLGFGEARQIHPMIAQHVDHLRKPGGAAHGLQSPRGRTGRIRASPR